MKSLEINTKYKKMFLECIEVCERYELPTDLIELTIKEIENFRVTTPVIGGFSTGKSSMLNAILANNILTTQITPETSVPTEIYYGDNKVFLYNISGIEEISIDQFKDRELDANNTKLVKIEYNNDFLREVKDVKIVDMPGFDSGLELHNKAIDKYMPNSLAYIITFSADEPVIKESIANFLKELKLHEVPVYIIITKCDKVTPEELEKCKEFMIINIPKLLGINNVRIACVKSKKDKDVIEAKEIFYEIQEKSQELFKTSFDIKLKSSVSLIEKYLISRLNNKELSNSELEQKEKELLKCISEIMDKLEKEKRSFEIQTRKCIEAIKVKISSDLSASSSSLETMILNGNDIKEKVNLIVRNAVMTGIKSEIEPKMQRYMKNIGDIININVLIDTEVNLDGLKIATDNMVKDMLVKSIPAIFAAVGIVLGGPIGAIIGGAVAIFIETFFKSKQDKDKREIAKQKVQNEIIPSIVEQAGSCIETEIISYIAQINEEIQAGIENQKQVMQKSLEDIKKQKLEEEELQKQQFEEINHNLEKVRSLVNGI
ncbi:dynamin family protein [Acetoanaerobium noterae]|uniref:dynamin family protein n=1 Tax=Acetoanaerobium noterae TaxID=745369 RepID=UPI00331997CE